MPITWKIKDDARALSVSSLAYIKSLVSHYWASYFKFSEPLFFSSAKWGQLSPVLENEVSKELGRNNAYLKLSCQQNELIPRLKCNTTKAESGSGGCPGLNVVSAWVWNPQSSTMRGK